MTRRAGQPDTRRVAVVPTTRGVDVAGRLQGWDRPLRDALTIAATVDLAAATPQAAMLDQALATIAALQRAGVISVARTCRGCRFFDTTSPAATSYWCRLLDQPLQPATLRTECAEYEAI